jgi:hypothetical protein
MAALQLRNNNDFGGVQKRGPMLFGLHLFLIVPKS